MLLQKFSVKYNALLVIKFYSLLKRYNIKANCFKGTKEASKLEYIPILPKFFNPNKSQVKILSQNEPGISRLLKFRNKYIEIGTINQHKAMKTKLLIILLLAVSFCDAQNAIKVTKKRPPELDFSSYKQIAVGDIVGSSGVKTERSMDLTDALSSKLFNTNTFEIVDRNALTQILSSQRGTEIKMINEATTSALSKKLNGALLIVGRIQNEKLYKEQKSQDQSIVVNGCRTMYWWSVTGDMTVQLKILDIKTGKMVYNKPVVQNIKMETKQECERKSLGDTEYLLQDAVTGLATEIAKIILPYDEDMTLTFEQPMITMFKNPFKKLKVAIQSFQGNDNATGIQILKSYADDTSLKPNLHPMAVYNYGVGLFIDNQYDLAATQFQTASTLGSLDAPAMTTKTQNERQYSRLMAKVK